MTELRWTLALTTQAEAELASFADQPIALTDAATAYKLAHSQFLATAKTPLEHGRPLAKAFSSRMGDVVWAWSSPKPAQTLKPNVEADALWLISATEQPLEPIIQFWVAHSGLSFALETFALIAAGTVGVAGDGGAPYLIEGPPSAATPWPAGIERTLRRLLLASTPDAQTAAKETAKRLRSSGSLAVRALIAGVFLETEWLDADLLEAATTKKPARFGPPALLASSLAKHAAWFASIPAESFDRWFLPRWQQHRTPFWLGALQRHGAPVVPALGAYLTALSRRFGAQDGPAGSDAVALTDTLSIVTGSSELAAGVLAVLDHASREKLSKDVDPKPAYVAWLKRSAIATLEAFAAKPQLFSRPWAKDLVPQLERLKTAETEAPPDEVPLEELPKALRSTRVKLPAFFTASAFTRPIRLDGKALPLAAVEVLGALLSKATSRDTLLEVKETLEPKALSLFAWDVFQAWLAAGGPAKEKWALTALGFVGDDTTAQRLAALIRLWPGESAHQRATWGLDALAELGSDAALLELYRISQRVRFRALQDRAIERMNDIAKRLGLSSEALADRLTPGFELDGDGSATLDFGSRQFTVTLDAQLKPELRTEAGKTIKSLPKPAADDDETKAAAATARFKRIAAESKEHAKSTLLRLELMMANERQLPMADFETYVVRHPVLSHVAQRLVWALWTGDVSATFRMTADGAVDAANKRVELPSDGRVVLVHPVRLTASVLDAWKKHFAELEQPFEQLERRVFEPELTRAQTVLTDFEGTTVTQGALMGLLNRGWNRGDPGDAGAVMWFVRPMNGLIARLTHGGYFISGGRAERIALGGIDFGPEDPWNDDERNDAVLLAGVSAVAVSEVLRDLALLSPATESSDDEL